MSRHARRRRDTDAPRGSDLPSIEQCLFHRCEEHEGVPQLNASESFGGECGGCLAEELLAVKAQLLLALDGYAERLAYSHALAGLLASARARLNLLSPGAGDSLVSDEAPQDWRAALADTLKS
jgi:hypothetical protein